jgi:enamine deaminase RidA (YjgF/YER057c/UK114 family)
MNEADIHATLAKLGLTLPAAPPAVGFYVPAIRTGNLVITSGQLPFVGKELAFVGKLGDTLHEQDGRDAAQLCVLNAIAQVKAIVGDLSKVKRILRVEGYVQSAQGFNAQPAVLNGASELLVELFGDAGRHTRMAMGVNELPLNAAVEIGIWVEVE